MSTKKPEPITYELDGLPLTLQRRDSHDNQNCGPAGVADLVAAIRSLDDERRREAEHALFSARGSHMTDEQIAELFDNTGDPATGADVYWSGLHSTTRAQLLAFARALLHLNPAGDWQALAAAVKALPSGKPGHEDDGPDVRFWAELGDVAFGDYNHLKGVADSAETAASDLVEDIGKWRAAVETALGVEADEVEHTPEWAHERFLAHREISNEPAVTVPERKCEHGYVCCMLCGYGVSAPDVARWWANSAELKAKERIELIEANRRGAIRSSELTDELRGEITRLRALLESAANVLNGEGYAATAAALRQQLQDVAGSIPAAVSTGAGCDSGDGERGLVPSQVGRREELPPSTGSGGSNDEPLSDDYLGKALRRLETIGRKRTTEQRLHGLTMAVAYLVDHLKREQEKSA